MQLIGFNLKKIHAERSQNFKRGPINTNIEFVEVEKDKVDFLKDLDAIRISFIFTVTYADPEKKDEPKQGEVLFEGDLALSATKDELKDIIKSWKKKQLPDNIRFPLINYILKKCSARALSLEDELNLPTHIPFPQVQKSAQQPPN